MTRVPFGIRGTGSEIPSGRITNDELERLVDTSDEWILQRTGIKERRRAPEGVATSHLSIAAARKALDDAGMQASELDLVIVATVTPDHNVPATACRVQSELGATNAGAFDMAAGCTGFVYSTNVAAQYLWSGSAKNVLVIGAECLSRITNYTDRTSCILFGDAAGAVIYSTEFDRGEVLSSSIHADGGGYEVMHTPGGGSMTPLTPELLAENADKLIIRGREVYKFAVSRMVELVRGEMASNPQLELGAVVPHQVNQRILDAARERLDLPAERIFVNIYKYGNTSAASVPVALDEACRTGFFNELDDKLVVMCAFGAGLTWGSVGLKW